MGISGYFLLDQHDFELFEGVGSFVHEVKYFISEGSFIFKVKDFIIVQSLDLFDCLAVHFRDGFDPLNNTSLEPDTVGCWQVVIET